MCPSRIRWLVALGFLGACGGQTLADFEAVPESDAGAGGSIVAAPDSATGGTGAGILDASGDSAHDASNAFDSALDASHEAGGGDAITDWLVGESATDAGFGVGPAGFPDNLGDVTRPGSDVLEAAVYVSPDWLDFRLRFAATPLQPDATNDISWCLDPTQSHLVGPGCAGAFNSDPYLSISLSPFGSPPYVSFFAGTAVDPCTHIAYEASTHTLRVVLPRSVLADDGVFDYGVLSNFGGSFGKHDKVPDAPPALTSVLVAELPPFSAGPSCDLPPPGP